MQELLNNSTTEDTYAGTAGSIERVPDDEQFAKPGTGTSTWTTYDEVATQLGLPVVALTSHKASLPPGRNWDRIVARCVTAGEGLLLVTAVLACLLVACSRGRWT